MGLNKLLPFLFRSSTAYFEEVQFILEIKTLAQVIMIINRSFLKLIDVTESNIEKKKESYEIKTFNVAFDVGEIKENITINTNAPSNPYKEQIFNQAFKFHSQGNILEAAKLYKYFINQGFKDHRVFSNYGTILKDIGKLQEAELSTRKAIELNPNFAEAHSNLGLVLKDLSKLQEAELSTRKAIEIKPNYAIAHYNLGNILSDLGKLKEAELSIRKSIELNPDLAEAHSNLGSILNDLSKPKEAELSIRKSIELNPDLAEAHSNLGLVLKDLSKLQEAELSTRKAIELNPDLTEAHFNLGSIFYSLDRFEEAELSTRRAIELNPDFAEAYSTLGFILSDLGKSQEAEKSYHKAIELNPNYADAHRGLSIYYYLSGNLTLALKSIFKSYSLDPKNMTNKVLLNIFKDESNCKERNLKPSDKISRLREKNIDSNPLILKRPVEKELIDTLYKIKAQDQEKYQGPTYGNAIGSNYELFDRNESMIKTIKDDLTSISMKAVNSNILIESSFFTIFRSGGGLVSHAHLNKLDRIKGLNLSSRKFSLVYYLSVGDQNCDEPGILKLENPSQDILPNNGLIIIFPSARRHAVFYKGKKDRIIIGVNFYSI